MPNMIERSMNERGENLYSIWRVPIALYRLRRFNWCFVYFGFFFFVLTLTGVSQAFSQRSAPKQKPLLSFVMLSDLQWPNPESIQKEIQARIPGYRGLTRAMAKKMAPTADGLKGQLRSRFRPNGGELKSEIILGSIDGELLNIMFIGAPNPMLRDETFIESAWWWRSAYSDLSKRKSHVTISLPRTGKPRRDQLVLAQVTSAIIAKTKAVGVIWDTADAVYRASRFAKMVASADQRLPAELAVSVKLGLDTQFPRKNGKPAWLAMTYGLNSMGLKEVEYRGFDGDAPELVQLLWNVSDYLMAKGDVIGDNHTIGSPTKRQYVFKVRKSTLGAQGQVLRMEVVPPGKNSVHPKALIKPNDLVE